MVLKVFLLIKNWLENGQKIKNAEIKKKYHFAPYLDS